MRKGGRKTERPGREGGSGEREREEEKWRRGHVSIGEIGRMKGEERERERETAEASHVHKESEEEGWREKRQRSYVCTGKIGRSEEGRERERERVRG